MSISSCWDIFVYSFFLMAQSAGDVEYTDNISVEG